MSGHACPHTTPLAIPVCNLMNKCFEQGKIPEEWKDSNVMCKEIKQIQEIIDRLV